MGGVGSYTERRSLTLRFSVLANPVVLSAVLLASQFLVWYLFMPEIPTVAVAAPRYESPEALVKLFSMALCFIVAGALGATVFVPFVPKQRRQLPTKVLEIKAKAWCRVALLALAVTAVGEGIYVREIISNPSLIMQAFDYGNLSVLGERVRASRMVGLSSLNNLFLLPTAMLALIAFHPDLNPRLRRRARTWLWLLGAFTLAHALILAARMFFVYFLLATIGAYLVVQGRVIRVKVKPVVLAVGALALVVWAGALLRDGLSYGRLTGRSIWSLDVQRYVWSIMVEGYLGADFNNALVLLDCPPAMALWSTTMFRELFGARAGYDTCPGWYSAYGTVNSFALWWFDWGWAAFGIAWFVGFLLGAAYRVSFGMARSLSPRRSSMGWEWVKCSGSMVILAGSLCITSRGLSAGQPYV